MTPPVRIVISAVNLVEGGTLTVLRECIAAAVACLPPNWEIVALVHSADLVDEPRVRVVPIPDAKQSWGRRLYWEWFGFRRLPQVASASLWLSLHDITPRVDAVRQAVYCHNPSPFYRTGPLEAWLEPKFFLFTLLYASLYKAFIRRNHFVIVQQAWMRAEFERRMGPLPIVVAYPVLLHPPTAVAARPTKPFVFLYPALPRLFKNFETLMAAAYLLSARGVEGFEIRLTISGRENRTAHWLFARYAGLAGVCFIGRQSRDEMLSQYRQASAVVFPSRLETWGLPISEAKAHGLPLLLADLPYAHEAVGDYDRVGFFAPDDASALADQMHAMIEGRWQPTGNRHTQPGEPFAGDWASLWALLTQGLGEAAPSSHPHNVVVSAAPRQDPA